MLTSDEEASLRDSLRFKEQDRWLHLLYRRESSSPISRCGILRPWEPAVCLQQMPRQFLLSCTISSAQCPSVTWPCLHCLPPSPEHLPEHSCRNCRAIPQENTFYSRDVMLVTSRPAACAERGSVWHQTSGAAPPVLEL